jgi:hypothetical protein
MKLLVLAGALALLSAMPASARPQSGGAARPACAGTIATIRFSAVKPGQWPVFARAVAAHRAWYQQHRSPNTVTLSRVLARGGQGYSDSEAVTMTLFRDPAAPVHDKGWDAFVADYKASSTIQEERRVCVPKM